MDSFLIALIGNKSTVSMEPLGSYREERNGGRKTGKQFKIQNLEEQIRQILPAPSACLLWATSINGDYIKSPRG